jgi:hypothetical protein
VISGVIRSLNEKAAAIPEGAPIPLEGWGTDVPRLHLRENVSRADEELAARIADAPAPF